MKKKTLLLSAFIATICVSPAFAREATLEQKTNWYFDRMDLNHDGVISPAEHEIFWRDMFARADLNHDGVITYDELIAAKRAEKAMFSNWHEDVYYEQREVKLPNRVNTNPSDHSINKGYDDEPNSRYLSR